MEPHLGQQQFAICRRASIEGQRSGDVALGRQLGQGITVHRHFHDRGRGVRGEVLSCVVIELDGGQHSIVQGRGDQLLVLPLHLGQEGASRSFENALDTTLR